MFCIINPIFFISIPWKIFTLNRKTTSNLQKYWIANSQKIYCNLIGILRILKLKDYLLWKFFSSISLAMKKILTLLANKSAPYFTETVDCESKIFLQNSFSTKSRLTSWNKFKFSINDKPIKKVTFKKFEIFIYSQKKRYQTFGSCLK